MAVKGLGLYCEISGEASREMAKLKFRLKRRSDIHWERKIWHMAGVGLIAALYAYLPLNVSMAILSICWLAFVPADFLRQYRPELNEFLMTYFGPIMREHEEKRLAGTTYLLTGVGLVALIFPREIVILTLLFLAFADPVASIVGIKFGRTKIFGHKSLQGFVAALTICFLVTFIYLQVHEILTTRLLAASLLAGLVGALAELVPVASLDDNLTLPLLSAFGLWGIFELFGHPVVIGALLQ